MKKFLIFFICTFFWASYCLAERPHKYEKTSPYWNTYGDGPKSENQFIKKFLEGRKIDPLEGVWMESGAGIIGITKSGEKYLKYYINVPNFPFNGTIETTFFKTPSDKVFSGMVRIDFPNGENYLHVTSTATLILENINLAEVQIDKYGGDATFIRKWPLDFYAHNEKINPKIVDKDKKKPLEKTKEVDESIIKELI